MDDGVLRVIANQGVGIGVLGGERGVVDNPGEAWVEVVVGDALENPA